MSHHLHRLEIGLFVALLLPGAARSVAAQTPADTAATLQAEALREDQHGTPAGFRRAIELRTQAVRVLTRLGNRAGEGRALDDIGSAYRKMGRPDSAQSYYARALAAAREVGDRRAEGTTLHNIGIVHEASRRPDSALAYYRQALGINREVGDRAGEGGTLHRGGNMHFALGNLDSAMAYWRQATAIRREVGDRAGEGSSVSNIGLAHKMLGQKDSALSYFHQALAIRRDTKNRVGEGSALQDIGQVHYDVGRSDSALFYYARSLQIQRAGGDRDGQAGTLHLIGQVQNHLGRRDSALIYYHQALKLERQVSARLNEGSTLHMVGNVHSDLGRPDSALAYWRQALAIRREVGDRVGEGRTLINIGNANGKLGQRDSALVYYGQALVIQRQTGDRVSRGTTLHNMGKLHSDLRHVDSALAYYSEALSIRREVQDRAGESSTLRNLAWLHSEVLSRPDLQVASAYYDSAAALHAAIAGNTGSEANRVSYAEQQVSLFENWTFTWLAREPEVGRGPSAVGALGATERGRAQALLNLMRQASSEALAGGDLVAEGTRLLDVASSGGTAVLSYLTTTADTLLIWLAVPGREVEVIRRAVSTDTLAELVRSLRRSLGIDGAARGRVALRGGAAPEDETQTGDRGRDASRLARTNSFAATTSVLAGWLLPPELDRKLGDVRELVIIPHGVLGLVPFAALPVDSTRTPLGSRYALRFAPSLAVLAEAEGRPGLSADALRAATQRRALVVGNPLMPARSSLGDEFKLSPLPGAEREAREVADQLHTVALTGAHATEAEVRERLPTAAIVHLATHGYAYATEARVRRSFIAMAPSPLHDGFLTVAEVIDDPALKLSAELVVLSACQTGLGDLRQAEGTVGLQRAFLARGARSILVSMWSVSDAATALLMNQFYTHWLSDSDRPSKAEALRRAQVELSRKPGFEHPRFWAAFQLAGAG